MPGGVVAAWPRNQLLIVEVGRPGRRHLVIPVALMVIDDLVRSWLDLIRLVGLPFLYLGLGRLLGPRAGRVGAFLELARRSARADRGACGAAAGSAPRGAGTGPAPGRMVSRLLGLGLDGVWRVWTEVRRGGRRTLLEVRPAHTEVCIRLW